ncbi:ATP-binding cassette domain-containing protein [Bradyrhizobium sp. LHD-71]|uniref:ATP-binding cassette domain-containing protein n=1 Tax=Bradyrhizobium sp. LHD-71 TaxID=3072141 RepID=UPI00280F0144|nr:ATP-binding cassette domain-containing protein [Bradyrhizobium sp. LHD-71]MDQ8732739.1 ATP-binding cassette domain-containing protein [Bradyrhizobium sp. LHD-71]
MAPPLIQLKDIALTFGGTPLLTAAELSLSPGERVCLVGRNGSGKSTLLKIAGGLVEQDHGTRFIEPGATVRYLPQEPDFGGAATTLAYVEAGLGPADDRHTARYLLEQLGLTGDEDPAHLSGGEARRAALARVLAPSPDILLLDEPTNHLDLPTIEWLERELDSRNSALVIISHDRRFLSNLSRATVWLDRGETRRIERGFADFETWRDEMLAEEELNQHKLDRKIVAEEHWLRYGVSGRRKRNVKRLANLQALREARRTYKGATGKANLAAATAEKSGAMVLEAKGLSIAFDDRPIVVDFSTRIQRGDRIGIVGPNGSGKTTLVSLLTGALPPDAGTLRLGVNLEMATLDQHRESLDGETTLADALTGGRGDTVMIGDKPKHVVSYMQDFLFAKEQMRTPLRVLSGGERGRLMLARALAKPSNVLVLDEPTNDLDLETLDVLEEMLGDYQGTVLLISHDRDFLDRVVSAVIVPEGDGKWVEYAGGYSDMLKQRGADVARPTSKASAKIETARSKPDEAATRPQPTKRKLSFNEKHALETLPKTMATLQAEIAAHQKLLADPELFAKDRKRFEATSMVLAAAQDKLHQAEERWLELEMLREELGG